MLGILSPLYGGGFLVALAQLTVFYYISAAFLHYVVPAVIRVRSIQVHPRQRGAVIRDAVYSAGPLVVKAFIWAIVEQLHSRNIGLLYEGSMQRLDQVLYAVLCVALLDYLHDTWFYWTHRLLHCKLLYRHVHYIHHKSTVPSAFTGYSFHVIEAFIVFANEVIVCFLFPIHMGVHRVYHLLTTLIHEGGHAGYEIAPFIPSLEQFVVVLLGGTKLSKDVNNTVQHHDMHHRSPMHHFSLYFTHWDRLMGTLHPSYDAKLFSYF